MKMNPITEAELAEFERWLLREEYAPGTAGLYLRNMRRLAGWLGQDPPDKERLVAWKRQLAGAGRAPATVNTLLAAANAFLRFRGREDCRVRALRIQRRAFRGAERDLSREEYLRLVETAEAAGRERLSLTLQTVCASGIRVSELRHITVEAAEAGRAEVALKGKIRTILLPESLCRKLLDYAGRENRAAGEIFLTKTGRSLSRKQVWAEMKSLCQAAGVPPEKVYPHNLRHLFARMLYSDCRDVALLADVLGHSSLETTRLYLITTGTEHARRIARLDLVPGGGTK